MNFQPRHNPILGIALGLALANFCILSFGVRQPQMVMILSLLAAFFAIGSFFFKTPSSRQPSK